MLVFLGRRVLALVPLLFVVSLIVFALVPLVPGDPAITLAGENATAEQVEAIRQSLGLNDPLLTQYGRWISGLVTLDFGVSLVNGQSVLDAVVFRLPVTLSLTLAAVLIALLIAVPLGVAAARRPGSWIDRIAMLGATIGVAVPSFWLAGLLVIFFVVQNRFFPAIGYVPLGEDPILWLRHITLPALALGVATSAELARQIRGSLINVLQQDYVRTARAKGLRERAVTYKHALKNAAVPVVTVLGLQITHLLGGTVIIEYMFGLPGLGSLAITSVLGGDIAMIQGIVVLVTLIVVTVNILVDLSYGYFNPKVRGA